MLLVICLTLVPAAEGGWARQTSGTFAWLRAVHFVDKDHGWVGGSNGTLLTTSDGGSTWKRSRRFTDDSIRDVYFADRNRGWLLCSREFFQNGPRSYLLRTDNGGETWQRVNFDPETGRMQRLLFLTDGTGYAAGEGGTLWRLPANEKDKFKATLLPVQYLILGGSVLDANQLVLVGGGGTILFTINAGSEWTSATMVEPHGGKLNSVYFTNPKNGWAVGDGGAVFYTNNGGKLWRRQNSGAAEDLLDVRFVDRSTGFAVGDKGVILRFGDRGVWSREPAITANRLERVFFVDGKGFAVGFGGEILTYKPDGAVEGP